MEGSLSSRIPGDIWIFNGEEFEIMEIGRRKDGCLVIVLGEVGQEPEDLASPTEISQEDVDGFEGLEIPEGMLNTSSSIRTIFP